MNIEDFVEWLDKLTIRAIPDNFEEFTAKQLRDYSFEVIFKEMEVQGFVPPDEEVDNNAR